MKPDSIKKAKIEPIDEYDDNCIQHAVALVLNHKEIKTFVVKYNLEGANRSSTKDDWKKTEKKKLTIDLNALYAEKRKIYSTCVSICNSKRQEQVIL